MGRIEQSIINLNKEQKISGKGGNFGKKISGKNRNFGKKISGKGGKSSKKISGKGGPILYIPVYLTPFL
ncbi:MAG: hypothetical protein SO293_02390 [Alloprevotella sp.]|nr:hypothetical protein [Alloprevotella sp.]